MKQTTTLLPKLMVVLSMYLLPEGVTRLVICSCQGSIVRFKVKGKIKVIRNLWK